MTRVGRVIRKRRGEGDYWGVRDIKTDDVYCTDNPGIHPGQVVFFEPDYRRGATSRSEKVVVECVPGARAIKVRLPGRRGEDLALLD